MTFELQFIAIGTVAATMAILAALAAKPVLAQRQASSIERRDAQPAPCTTELGGRK